MTLWQMCSPPAVRFTINNGIERVPSLADVKSLFDIFSRNTRVRLVSEETLAPDKVYLVDALMRQTSTDFYKWYTKESEATTKISVLVFSLLSAYRNIGETFVVCGRDLHRFQMLKQRLWDSFWLAFYLNGTPIPVEITVSHQIDATPNLTHISITGGARTTSAMLATSPITTDAGLLSVDAGLQVTPYCEPGESETEPHVQIITRQSMGTVRQRSDVYQLLN